MNDACTRIRSIAKIAAMHIPIVVCLISLAGCARSQADSALKKDQAVAVTVIETKSTTVPIYSEFAAQTYARNLVEVRGRVEGYVEKWLFKPGDEVKAGQTLYVLDLRPYQAAVDQARGSVNQSEADSEFAQNQVSLLQAQANLASAEANLLKARQDVDRLTPLVKADAASKQDLDAAVASLTANEATVRATKATVDQAALSTRTQINSMKAKVESMKAALNTAELRLQYATITAPISGRIGDTLVPVGGLVQPNSAQPLTTIVPLDIIWVRFKIAESEYLSWTKGKNKALSGGESLTLMLTDNAEFPFKGRIEDSLNQIDSKTGTLELQASFPNPQHALLPGQFGRVRIQVDNRDNAVVIPQKAVQQMQSLQLVYTVGADNKVAMQPVTTGYRFGNQWVIEKGLNPGDRVIVEGQLKVRQGAQVKPLPYNPSENSASRKNGE